MALKRGKARLGFYGGRAVWGRGWVGVVVWGDEGFYLNSF